jgi:mannose-6-phosphate isomerase
VTHLYPLTFDPVLKDYIWGGHNLAQRLGRDIPAGQTIAESWEIAAHPNGTAVVRNGPLAGKPLTDLVVEMGADLIGTKGNWALEREKFPLLIKLLDASRKLSVQVHPDDDYARAHEGNELGKTEMWVVLHAEPDAAIILGVPRGTTPDKFHAALRAGTLEAHLHVLPVKAGDHVCVPAGSLHAILGGLLIAEIQQNSDTTYRVYDWNRMGKDGRPRPLHVKQALDVINFDQVAPELAAPRPVAEASGVRREELCRNAYFVVERFYLEPGQAHTGVNDGRSLEIFGSLSGEVLVTAGSSAVTLPAVRFCLLPAGLGPYTISTRQPAVLLRTYLP